MKRGVTPTVSLLLVGVCLAMSGGAVTSVTGDKSGRSYGASGRRMLQETDQSPTKSDSTEDSHDATLQRAPENSTDISNESPIAAADKSPDVSGSDTIKADESDAAATASEPDTTTLSSDADGKAGETSAGSEEDDIVNSGQAAASSGADQPDSHDSDGIVADDKQAADLTFDEALAQTALGAELSDPTPSSNTSSSNQSTSDDLTFDQAVAATNGTQSITEVIANSTQSSASELKALDPRAASPVRESLLPYVESANGSLSAAIQESDDASNATAASSRDGSTLNVTHWTGLANATVTKVGEELTKTATASTSLLDEDMPAISMNSSAVNATRDVITGAASSAAGAISTAAGLLSNATAALTTTNNTELNATNATLTAGGTESDSLLGSEVLNATVADGVLHSSVDKVTGALSGVKSWLNSSKADGLQAGTTKPSGSTKGVRGAIANATDGVLSISRAAAAELGTEEDTLIAPMGSRTNQSARNQQLPGLPEYEEALELEDVYTRATPSRASASRVAADKASSITNPLPSANARPAGTQAVGSASAGLPGTNSSTDATALASSKGNASKAASLADQRASEEAQDEEEQRTNQQVTAGSLTQPKGSSTSTAGTGATSAKTARYADGQLTTHGVTPSKLTELDEDFVDSTYADPAQSRAQAEHKTALGGFTAGGQSSSRDDLPASARYTQTDQLLGDDGDYNPQAALGTNFQSGKAKTGVSQHSKTAPIFVEQYGDYDKDDAVLGRTGIASSAGTAASQAARSKSQEDLGTSGSAVNPQAGSSRTGTHALPGKRPQSGTSASALDTASPSSRDNPVQGFSGVLQPQQASHATGKTGGVTSHDDELLPLGQHTRSGFATGADSAGANSNALPSVKPISAEASDTLTPAQQRELERESAYKASTGSAAAALADTTSSASGKSKASQPSWGAIAGQADANAAQGTGSGVRSKPASVGGYNSEVDQSSTVKQQSLGDGESDADMEDYDPRAFATGSTDSVSRAAADYPADATGQAQAWNPRTSGASTGSRVQPSMGGEEAYEERGGDRDFMVNRDPTDPSSVLGTQQSRGGQLQAGSQHRSSVNAAGTGSGAAAGKTEMSLVDVEEEESPLLAGAEATKKTASQQSGASSHTSHDALAGPVVAGAADDKTASRQQSYSKQSSDASSTLHGLLDNVIDNWVVITALSALVCTGAVLGFVFLRGFVPSPYDAITISNSGNGGYAGNKGYHGVSREDEENGWEGWADDDLDANPQAKKSSNGNSPPRGTGVGKLKKGTFAKKKPANWSNDF